MKKTEVAVDIKVKNSLYLEVFGALGSVKENFEGKDIIIYDNKILIKSKINYKTIVSKLNTMVAGVSKGYFLQLQMIGLGYRYLNLRSKLLFKLGYTHYIQSQFSRDIWVIGYKNKLGIFGLDLQKVNQIGRAIKEFKKVNIYTGKGIRYKDENIKQKVGKVR